MKFGVSDWMGVWALSIGLTISDVRLMIGRVQCLVCPTAANNNSQLDSKKRVFDVRREVDVASDLQPAHLSNSSGKGRSSTDLVRA